MNYKYTDNELKKLLSSIVILVDTREQKNAHIRDYWNKHKVPYEMTKLDIGDYSAYLPKCEELGIHRDMFFLIAIERKNSVDELAQTIKERTRWENELIRSQKLSSFLVLVEDLNGYANLINGQYKSEYNPKALTASLKSFEAKYEFNTVFGAKEMSAHYIYYHLYYQIRNQLKN